ncbi:SpoIIE family protein phosphatase [Streptacidiphilus sp. N1-12]|uniref:SpoIIE family protein phosphatase n=2 Tax=Streptacidiphilus alkalitolerans TaxID=3342712 RepID=A0ABV6W8C9_9ACTN
MAAPTAALLGLLLAAAALLGLPLHSGVLRGALSGRSVPMEPNSAVALVLLTGTLLLIVRAGPTEAGRRTVGSAAVAAAVIGSLCAPESALGLVLAAAALPAICSHRPRVVLLGQALGVAVAMLGQARLYSFAYSVRELGPIGNGTGMAVSTALALILIGVAVFLVRPDEGLAALLTNAGTTGLFGRWTFGATLTLIPLLGRLQLAGEDARWFGVRQGITLMVLGRVSALLVVSFGMLSLARRAETARAEALRKIGEYAQLQAFMDHTPAVVFSRDLDGRYLAANSRFEHLVGAAPGQVVGALVEDLLTPEAAVAARRADHAVRTGRGSVQQEEVVQQEDGPHHYLTTLFPLTDGAGRPYAVCGVSLDVTDRVLARREADRLQRRFRDLLESGPDATVISDGDGIIVMVNAQTEKLFDHRREDLVGRPLSLLLPERAEPSGPLTPSELEPSGAEPDLRARHRDGREFPVEISVSPLETEDGLLVSAAIRDITGRRQAEAERRALYEQQRRIALTLQHSLMGTPPQLPQLPTASRYLASAQDAGVGGDWFDLIPLDGGRFGILIGDVMGRGVDAAAVMGQLRAAAHALAQTGLSPARLMTALDAFVAELPDQLVTCCYLVLDPGAGELTLCSAGHLPALLTVPGQPPQALAAPISVPLGVGGFQHRQAVHRLPPGSTLALYTDGLVETPDTDIDLRIQLLADTLESALAEEPSDGDGARVLDRAADCLLRALIPDPEAHNDDVTLLLVRLPQVPSPADPMARTW